MSRRRDRARAVGVASLLLLAGCTGPGDSVARPPEDAILIGAFDFGESEVLAHIYAGALEAEGYPVHVLEHVASREIMPPAIEQERVDLVPEYEGSLLRVVDPTAATGKRDADHAAREREALVALLEERGIEALEPAPATNSNVFVVTPETADSLDLERISDLQPNDGNLVFGGPPECPSRPLCLLGLEETYGVTFGSFQPLDAGGPLTLGALLAGDVDVALLFETDPDIRAHDLVILRDDRHLQPAENVLPVMRSDVLDEHGARLESVLNGVSAKITTEELRRLNARIDDAAVTPAEAAGEWLQEKGLS